MATPASDFPILRLVLDNYRNFNARATRDALLAYWRHVEGGGRMFWAVAGAMSSAQLGISLAPAIRAGLVHGLSVTGANLEESLFRLVAHDHYKAFRAVEKFIVPVWKRASAAGERRFWHEYFYELVQSLPAELFQGDPEAC